MKMVMELIVDLYKARDSFKGMILLLFYWPFVTTKAALLSPVLQVTWAIRMSECVRLSILAVSQKCRACVIYSEHRYETVTMYRSVLEAAASFHGPFFTQNGEFIRLFILVLHQGDKLLNIHGCVVFLK